MAVRHIVLRKDIFNVLSLREVDKVFGVVSDHLDAQDVVQGP